MANSLSKILITILYHIVSLTFALESCGHIGDNRRETQGYSAYDGADGFYLDIGNRACCSGNITSWRVCYYTPDPGQLDIEDYGLYRVKYAVYRRNGMDYIQVSNLTFNFTLDQEELSGHWQKRNTSINEDSPTGETLDCYDMPLNTSFAVRAGDIIGACVVSGPDLDDSSHSNVQRLSEVNNQSHPTPTEYLLHNDSYLTSCRMNETLPSSIIDFKTHFSRVRAQRLHISAYITIGKCNTIMCYS